jgi:uncharacterized protein with ParB-like and HNH nuclease domain
VSINKNKRENNKGANNFKSFLKKKSKKPLIVKNKTSKNKSSYFKKMLNYLKKLDGRRLLLMCL